MLRFLFFILVILIQTGCSGRTYTDESMNEIMQQSIPDNTENICEAGVTLKLQSFAITLTEIRRESDGTIIYNRERDHEGGSYNYNSFDLKAGEYTILYFVDPPRIRLEREDKLKL